MNKINITQIMKILKKIIANACVIFAVIIFLVGLAGYTLLQSTVLETQAVFINFVYALIIASAYKIFAVKALPVVSRHIIFFALMYVSFIFVYMPSVNKYMNSQTTLYLTVSFIAIYLICAGLVSLIKFAVKTRREKKQKYETQFGQLKK